MTPVETLRTLRLEKNCHPEPTQVVELGKSLIKTGDISRAGDEAWDIYEQTLIAALEISDDNLALECLSRLSDKFPSSGRVHALRGMMLECTQDASEAIKFYNRVLEVEPTNIPILKRRIVFAKSSGRVGEAIEYATQYLDTYYSDADAWSELAELYTTIGAHERATFSWAEAVLLKPFDHEIHASYADSIYIQAMETSNETLYHLSLKHYLRSVELCDDYLRGFCGIKVCCNTLLSKVAGTTDSKALQKSTSGPQSYVITEAKVRALDIMSVQVLGRLVADLERTSKQNAIEADFAKTLVKSPVSVVR